MKITQFCIPAAGEVMVLTDDGDLWERYRDPKHFASAPFERQRYLWRKLDGPAEEIKAAQAAD